MAGFTPLIKWLKHKFYLKSLYYGLKRELDGCIYSVPSRLEYSLHIASPSEMVELFQLLSNENKDSIMEVVLRKIFYDHSLTNCYLARATANNEPCYIQWMILPEENPEAQRFLRQGYPQIASNEVMLEHAYTFKKYRGQGIMGSVMAKLATIAQERGYQQIITYVSKDNIASLKGCEKAGFQKFRLWQEARFFFTSSRKVTELKIS